MTPKNAARIWVEDEVLHVELPDGEIDVSHIIKLPCNEFGMKHIVTLLQARNATSRLGEAGDPTQFQTDKTLAQMAKAAKEYKGPIKRPLPKLALTPERRSLTKELIRRFINV